MNIMNIVNTSIPILALFLVLFLLYAFSSKNKEMSDFFYETKFIDGWEISVIDSSVKDCLENVCTAPEHRAPSKASLKPSRGKTFLIVRMIADKEEGTSAIDWSNMYVKDSSGNTYSRINDSFLEELGYKRMDFKPLISGINRGWIAFEINKNAHRLKLDYRTNNETVSLKLKT